MTTWPRRVFSIRPFTILATAGLSSHERVAVIIGVLILLAPFIISFMRGTPSVTSEKVLKKHSKEKIQS